MYVCFVSKSVCVVSMYCVLLCVCVLCVCVVCVRIAGAGRNRQKRKGQAVADRDKCHHPNAGEVFSFILTHHRVAL